MVGVSKQKMLSELASELLCEIIVTYRGLKSSSFTWDELFYLGGILWLNGQR